MSNSNFNILFVCLGNICRSPTAEGIFTQKIAELGLSEHVKVDSCGTGAWHVGSPPDQRTQLAATQYGYDLSALRARKFEVSDFLKFDYILAMDTRNLADVMLSVPNDYAGQLQLFLDYSENTDLTEVPDPYYGGQDGFDRVLALIESASDGLIKHLQQKMMDVNA